MPISGLNGRAARKYQGNVGVISSKKGDEQKGRSSELARNVGRAAPPCPQRERNERKPRERCERRHHGRPQEPGLSKNSQPEDGLAACEALLI